MSLVLCRRCHFAEKLVRELSVLIMLCRFIFILLEINCTTIYPKLYSRIEVQKHAYKRHRDHAIIIKPAFGYRFIMALDLTINGLVMKP